MPSETNIQEKSRKANIIIPSILISLILFLGIALLYVYLDMQKQTRSIRNLLHEMTHIQSMAQLHINTKNQATANSLELQQQAISQLEHKITLQSQEKAAVSSNEIFLINKAQALIDLAHINAYWTADTRTTVALLDQADTLIAQTQDPKMLPVRSAIVQEREHQLNTPHVDLVRILSQLAADQTLINKLPIKQIETTPSVKPGVTNTVQSAWKKLQSLVILRHHAAASPVNLTFTDETYMRAALSLDFENAQWAILHNQPEIFILSLQDAVQILNRGFDTHASAQLKQRLLNLQHQKINIKTPITQDFRIGESP